VVLTSLSKHTRKDFQIIIAFGHSAFITSQSMFVLRNMVLKRSQLVEHSANVSHTTRRAVYPYVHALIKSKLTISCTTASVERCLSKMADRHLYITFVGGVINMLAKSLWRRTIELQLL